jgi:enoyl-CoA hydratase
MKYQHILVTTQDAVGIITLNRPEALNALSNALLRDLVAALDVLSNDESIGAIVLTGNEKAFAAGADIKEMQDQSFVDLFVADFPSGPESVWDRIPKMQKPVIAAVAGYAIGGGCELAMACDFILAADTAKFGQPEITIGTMPGAGGTQRLTRLIGKSKAMEMCLTGRLIGAEEAERIGLVSRVVPASDLQEEAVKTAAKIAALSRPAVTMVKEAVNAAYETVLAEGLRMERRLFQSTFALEDRKEGMAAFVEKRKPSFRHK